MATNAKVQALKTEARETLQSINYASRDAIIYAGRGDSNYLDILKQRVEANMTMFFDQLEGICKEA